MRQRNGVAIVGPDLAVRESLCLLLDLHGFASRAFASAEEFLASDASDLCQCLVTDIALPGMTGLELAEGLRGTHSGLSIVLLTEQPSGAIASRIEGCAALALLVTPVVPGELLSWVHHATQQLQ